MRSISRKLDDKTQDILNINPWAHNYLEVVKTEETLASRFSNIMSKELHDAKHGKTAIL